MSLITLLSGQVVAEKKIPQAVIAAEPTYGVVGSVIKMNAQASLDPFDSELSYEWSFISIPIGSKVDQESFRSLNDDNSIVSFSPDVVGEFTVGLVASNGVFTSDLVTSSVSIRALLVPHGRGLVPDGKWIWSYLRDAWNQVDGREWFETFWSALTQIVGSEMLKMYQIDFNKSIRDIQDTFQRRWLSYTPRLDIVSSDCTFVFGSNYAGTNATSQNLGQTGQVIILSSGEVIVTSGSVLPNVVGQTLTILYDYAQPDNLSSFKVLGLNTLKTGYRVESVPNPNSPPTVIPDPVADRVISNAEVLFGFQDTTWEFTSPITGVQIGDIIHFAAGPNTGFYRILSINGLFVTVAKKPANLSDATSSLVYKVNVYRPVGFKISQPTTATNNTIAIPLNAVADLSQLIPGRIVVVAGQAYTISRVIVDNSLPAPLVIITTSGEVTSGQYGLSWRTPHTVRSASQDFESLGVSTGDLLIVDVTNTNTQSTVGVVAQVVGVSGNTLGLVLTDGPVTPGITPDIPDKTVISLSTGLGIPAATMTPTGDLILTGDLRVVYDYVNSTAFKRLYWNKELTPSSDILVKGGTFRLSPKYIIRNRRIPVDDTLVSIPILQDWIVQPTIAESGGKIYQVKNGINYEIKTKPVSLVENSDFIIDTENAISEMMTFKTGTDIVTSETGHFLSRDIRPGDTFSIVEPITLMGDYPIIAILSEREIKLSRVVPRYVLDETVSANVRIKRKIAGKFLRFIPGGFTAASPAPDNLWAEVSFFDNSDAIEGNFGILVGLTKEDMDKISSDVHYRQAVSGLMYAFTRGSSIERIRLGAQILLGLPFAEHRGIIRSIENDYRLDANGNPVLGRMLVEDVDIAGTPEGIQRVYTFPIEGNSRLAGIETNPSTKTIYAVGDTVELFATLCKGVEVFDYLMEDLSVVASGKSRLQQFHTVRMRANDSVFSLEELQLVSSFLKKITPSYVAFIVASSIELEDDIVVDDKLKARLVVGHDVLIDDASFSIPHALMSDGKVSEGVNFAYLDDGFFWIRKSGKDLVTTFSTPVPSSSVSSSAGGLLTPGYGEGPVSKPGDILRIHNGLNSGSYTIVSVADGSLSVSGIPSLGFQTVTDQRFSILRPIKALIRSGFANITNGSVVVHVENGLQSEGVSPGDWLVVENSAGTKFNRYQIIRVGGGPIADNYSPVLSPGDIHIATASTETASGRPYAIYRPSFFDSPFGDIVASVQPVIPAGDNFITIDSLQLQALMDVGDELQDIAGSSKRFKVLDPQTLYVTPPLPSGTTQVRLCKPKRSSTPVGIDHRDLDPLDSIGVGLKESDASAALCTSGSKDITLRSKLGVDPYTVLNPTNQGILPGDVLQLLNGSNSTVDIGYGPGIYPIVAVTSSVVRLAVALTSNDSSAWIVIRRR